MNLDEFLKEMSYISKSIARNEYYDDDESRSAIYIERINMLRLWVAQYGTAEES